MFAVKIQLTSRSRARRSTSFTLDLQRTFVFFDAVTVKDAHFETVTKSTGLHTQRCIRTFPIAFSPRWRASSFSSGVIGLFALWV